MYLKECNGFYFILNSQVTQSGAAKQVEHFADWLDTLPHPIKIVIAG